VARAVFHAAHTGIYSVLYVGVSGAHHSRRDARAETRAPHPASAPDAEPGAGEREERKNLTHELHDQVINLDSRRCIIYDLWGAIVYSPILYRSGQWPVRVAVYTPSASAVASPLATLQ